VPLPLLLLIEIDQRFQVVLIRVKVPVTRRHARGGAARARVRSTDDRLQVFEPRLVLLGLLVLLVVVGKLVGLLGG
jgi:hypothetical protein